VVSNPYTLEHQSWFQNVPLQIQPAPLRIGKEYNDKTPALVGKVIVCTFLVYVIWEIPGLFHTIFRPFQFFLVRDPVLVQLLVQLYSCTVVCTAVASSWPMARKRRLISSTLEAYDVKTLVSL
jgi:hypothetical protein